MDFRSKEWQEFVREGALKFGVNLGELQLSMMSAYADELIRWNNKKNLTAITDPREVALKHFVDSTAAVTRVADGARIIDLGAGGGFPGIPLKICNPTLEVTLVDASRKKVSFMKHVIRTLKLKGIDAIHARVEDLACDPLHAGCHDVAVSRAFTELKRFVEMALPFLKESGGIVAMKGAPSREEMEAFQALSFKAPDGGEVGFEDLEVREEKYRLPVIGSERSVFMIRRKTV